MAAHVITRSTAILLDLLVPTIVVLALAGISLALRNLWAPVLAHGFNNAMGLLTFFLVGPIYGLW